MVKCGEKPFEEGGRGACENPVTLHEYLVHARLNFVT